MSVQGKLAFESIVNFGGVQYDHDKPAEKLALEAWNYQRSLRRLPIAQCIEQVDQDWLNSFVKRCNDYRKRNS